MYEYLQSKGLLEHGTTDEIVAAKKLYWASVRKAWKQQHRKEYKSYTISFNNKHQRLLENASIQTNSSVTMVIKNVCLHLLTNTPNIDKKIIGKIREVLVLFHTDLQSLSDKSNQTNGLIGAIIDKFNTLETTILSLLKND